MYDILAKPLELPQLDPKVVESIDDLLPKDNVTLLKDLTNNDPFLIQQVIINLSGEPGYCKAKKDLICSLFDSIEKIQIRLDTAVRVTELGNYPIASRLFEGIPRDKLDHRLCVLYEIYSLIADTAKMSEGQSPLTREVAYGMLDDVKNRVEYYKPKLEKEDVDRCMTAIEKVKKRVKHGQEQLTVIGVPLI